MFEGDEWTAEGGLAADCFTDGVGPDNNWVDDGSLEGFRRKKLSLICYCYTILSVGMYIVPYN